MKEEGLSLKSNDSVNFEPIYAYNPFHFIKTILDGRPVILLTDSGFVQNNEDLFVKLSGDKLEKLQPIVLSGFFMCGDRLGFEVYQGGADLEVASQVFI